MTNSHSQIYYKGTLQHFNEHTSYDLKRMYVQALGLDKNFIKVMCDYSATAVWNWDGCNCSYEDFPLSKETIALMEVWTTWHDKWNETHSNNFHNFEQFHCLGELIFHRVIEELPDYIVQIENY